MDPRWPSPVLRARTARSGPIVKFSCVAKCQRSRWRRRRPTACVTAAVEDTPIGEDAYTSRDSPQKKPGALDRVVNVAAMEAIGQNAADEVLRASGLIDVEAIGQRAADEVLRASGLVDVNRNFDKAGDPLYLTRGHGDRGSLCNVFAGTTPIRVAVMSTMRDVENQLTPWIEWYRLIGVSHLFLYFDDHVKDERSMSDALATYSHEFLSVVKNCPELQAEWETLGNWAQFGPFVDDRMGRQLLNLAHCLRRCRMASGGAIEAADWVLHLDHDELFLPPPDGLAAHFNYLTGGGCRMCLYQNFEAVPEDHTTNPFGDVTLFKVPQGRVPKTPSGGRGLEYWATRTKARNYYLYYSNGKSAVRISRDAASHNIAPRSVHVLFQPGEEKQLEMSGKAWTTFSHEDLEDIGLGWLASRAEEIVVEAKVLHYPATHYERLFQKYQYLNNFPAVRFGGNLVIPPSFHLEARDCYLAHAKEGESKQKRELKLLLERAAMIQDNAQIQEQLVSGTIVRIKEVGESLRNGAFAPPKSLAVSPMARRRMAPSAKSIESIKMMPRVDAEIMFRSSGLLKEIETGLDAVTSQLETLGWAACAFGVNPGVLKAALQEARVAQKKMSPGTTVVRNQVVNQNLARAHRGDKILFMREQGLSGQCDPNVNRKGESPGEAPALALLETALVDLGMRLDRRLQRSSLRVRITERCDAMLACYDGGGATYGPHIDNADGDGRIDGRILTILLYLNPRWDKRHGGELAIFTPSRPNSTNLNDTSVEGSWHSIWPEAGTLVFFRADATLHEVRATHAQRFALSLWFCGQPVDHGY